MNALAQHIEDVADAGPHAARHEAGPRLELGRPVVLALLLLLPLFLLPNYSFYHDNLVYALDVAERGWSARLHPHHLGYSATIWLIWKLLGTSINPLFVMVALGRLAGWLGLIPFAAICRRLGMSPAWSALAMVLLATSYGWWFHATSGAVYVPAVACSIACAGHLVCWQTEGATSRSLRRAAGWFLLATLWHQLAVLLLVPIVIALVRVRQVRALLWFVVPIGLCYVVAFVVLERTPDPMAFWHWATRYGHEGKWWWWEQAGTTDFAETTWAREWIGSHIRIFWATPFGQLLGPGATEPIAMAWQVGWPEARYRLVFPIVAALALVGGAIGQVRLARTEPETAGRLVLVGAAMLPVVLLTLTFDIQNAGFRLYYLPWLWLLLLLPLARAQQDAPRLVTGVLFAVCLGFVVLNSYAYAWHPYARIWSNPRYADLRELPAMPPGPLVHLGRGVPDWLGTKYIELFTNRAIWTMSAVRRPVNPSELPPSYDALRARLDGTPLFLTWEAYNRALGEGAPSEPTYVTLHPSSEARPYMVRTDQLLPVQGYGAGLYQFVEVEVYPP